MSDTNGNTNGPTPPDPGLPDDARPEDDAYDLWCELHLDETEDGEVCCSHCGKLFEDFSDMGCGYCDRRSPDWGLFD